MCAHWLSSCSQETEHSLQILKKLINKQRPAYARKQDPGMPSSHATSLSYLAAYMMITLSKPTEILLTLGSALFLVRRSTQQHNACLFRKRAGLVHAFLTQ